MMTDKLWRRYNDALAELKDALAEQEQDAYGYASRLAVALSEKHYKATAANWKPLPDLMGVLTQIDNMTASLVRQQAEPEQEPVACIKTNGELMWLKKPSTIYSKPRPLYTAPPRREWVGLTDEEIDKWNIVGHESLREFVRSLEAKLKDKNGEHI